MSDEKQNNRADDDVERRPEFCDPPPPTLTDAERLARCRETVHGQGLSMRATGDELRAKDAALDSRDTALREAQAENERLRFVVQVWAEECQRWGEILVKQRKDARPQPTAPSPGATDGESDYSDEITQEQLEALNRIIPDDEFADYKEIGSTDGGQPEAGVMAAARKRIRSGHSRECDYLVNPYVCICGQDDLVTAVMAADSGTTAVTINDRGEAERIATHYHGSVTGKGWMLANDIESALFEARAGGGAKASAEEVTRALFAKYAANDDIGCPEMIAEFTAALSERERAGIEQVMYIVETYFTKGVMLQQIRSLLPPATPEAK